jgi:putative cardiolipin synthase
MQKGLQTILLALVATGLTACASIDFDYPRVESYAPTDTDDTDLGQHYAEAVGNLPEGTSGFHTLENGIDALTARLLLAERAERSIDTQYYLIKTDTTSYAFIDALLKAADRGVHVRFLLDDVFTTGYDAGMAALDSHPNFEIRIFNAFNRGAMGRAWAGMTNLSRVNRRMHTKSFTVDNKVTIVGGRNIADEYFGAREDAKFGDLDVVGIGPVASDVSTMFDTFWNHSTALPVPAFANMPDDPAAELVKLRERIAEEREAIVHTPYADAVRATVARFLDTDMDDFEFAPYRLIYDTPDKGIKSEEGPELAITLPLRESLLAAKEEIIILSPYFVPRKSGIEFFSSLVEKGVRVVIVTNSLAANNHSTVHGGYMPSRKPLLRNGVELYEVRPDAYVPGAEIFTASGAQATMHTKAYLVDRKQVFIGSFNFDPRSANLNTESGVLIESGALGKWAAGRFDDEIHNQAWELYLDDDGRLRWRGHEGDEVVIYTKEPKASFGRRFTAGFMRIMPVRGQL